MCDIDLEPAHCDVCLEEMPEGTRNTAKRCGPPLECWIKAKNRAGALTYKRKKRRALSGGIA